MSLQLPTRMDVAVLSVADYSCPVASAFAWAGVQRGEGLGGVGGCLCGVATNHCHFSYVCVALVIGR
eukprot:1901968-Lingulodinium_polyedra.AAC.1